MTESDQAVGKKLPEQISKTEGSLSESHGGNSQKTERYGGNLDADQGNGNV